MLPDAFGELDASTPRDGRRGHKNLGGVESKEGLTAPDSDLLAP